MSMTPEGAVSWRHLADAVMGNVAAPPSAISVDEWSDALTPDAYRVFCGNRWTVPVRYSAGDGVEVIIQGTQKADGSIDEHGIRMAGAPYDLMTPEEARGIAAALVAAADTIDGSVGTGSPHPTSK